MIQLQFENCVEPKSLSTFRGDLSWIKISATIYGFLSCYISKRARWRRGTIECSDNDGRVSWVCVLGGCVKQRGPRSARQGASCSAPLSACRNSRASRVAANDPKHARLATKLAGFSFRWSHAEEITRKRSFSSRTPNWISTPLCNYAGDKLYWPRN